MKLIKPALVGILSATTLLGTAIPAFAAEGGDETKTANSTGSILFNAPDEETEPPVIVPPIDGGEDLDPDGEGETGQSGPLTIDYISDFNFGEMEYNIVKGATKAALSDVWRDGEGTAHQLPNMVQVTDIRSTNPGWALKVTQNGQFKAGEEAELKGATITIADDIITKNHDGFGAPSSSGGMLELGEARKVAWATPGTGNEESTEAIIGKGSSSIIFDGGVELNVPAGTQVELDSAYSTNLTWTLENTPIFDK